MYLDLTNYEPKGEPWQPPRRRPPLTHKQEKLLLAVIGFNLLLALLAPIGGSTVLQAVMVWAK